MNQSMGFDNLELIFVDDASTDSSREIIDKYSSKYSNINLYCSSKSHGYPGFGRNLGVKKASADYIMFIDNDDEYFEDYCEKMYDAISMGDVDCVASNYVILEKDKIIKKDIFSSLNNEKDNEKLLINLDEFYYFKDTEIWSKIFKRQIIHDNNIEFIENGLNEDTLFLYEYYNHSNNILYLDYYGYKWHRDGENLSYNSTKTTLTFINSYYDIVNLINRLDCEIEWNKLFKEELSRCMFRIAFSYENNQELKDMVEKLYDFEKVIEFNGSLNNPVFTFLNNFIVNNHISMSMCLFVFIRTLKRILDLFRKITGK